MTKYLICLLLVCTTQVWAQKNQVSKDFENLKLRYIQLRNIPESNIDTLEEVRLAKEFSTFSQVSPQDANAALALYYAALLFERVYEQSKEELALSRALASLGVLIASYPENQLADDAYIKKGDLLLSWQKDSAGASTAYKEVLKRYPDSDMREVARARLRAMESDEAQGEANHIQSTLAGKEEKALPGATIIVIDPGHGGEDFGAKGIGGLLEKDIALSVALELYDILSNTKDVSAFLTRNADTFVPLSKRTKMANDLEADLFISLHVNASPEGKHSGYETYYLDTTQDEASKLLAKRENSLYTKDGDSDDIGFMISDLIQSGKLEPSINLAHMLHRILLVTLKNKWEGIKDLGVRKAPFYVLVGAHMPCALVELFYIDNHNDASYLSSKEFRRDIARGLARGIEEYVAMG